MLGIILTIIVIIIIILILIFLYYYNRIVVLGNRIDNSWAQIDVQLKKRADLVPNLMETVKGYMRHERKAIKMVTDSREKMLRAKGPAARAKAGNMLEGALKTIFALAENYPKLRASEIIKVNKTCIMTLNAVFIIILHS